MTEADAFSRFHEELKLNPDEVGFARGFPDEIRDALSAGGVSITHSFLQGSLPRGTAVSPLKDVDMVVCLDRDEYGCLLEDPLGSDQAMTILQQALAEELGRRYPELRFGERKAHALPIELGEDYPSFDLVPAFETTTDDDDVLIADRDDQRWERSNTRELIRVVANANQTAGGRLIHIVRMVKHAVRTKLHKGFPGLIVESMAIAAVDQPMAYAPGCLVVFESGAQLLGGPIPDPTGRHDLAPKIEAMGPEFTVRAKSWFESEAADARRARDRAEAGDHEQATAWWYRVFGPPFLSAPTHVPIEEAAGRLMFSSAAARPSRAWRST